MRRFIALIILSVFTIGLSAISVSAQSGNRLVDISVNLSCSSIGASIVSDYDTAVNVYVLAGTTTDEAWNLVNDIGAFFPVGAKGTGSQSYSFERQDANRQISFSIRVYNNETSLLVAQRDGRQDCDGESNNAPVPTTVTTTTNSTTTASFLASCNIAGGITVQPIGGVAFTINGNQIAQGTAMAIANAQNFAIATVGNISAIGTPANAIQLVATDGYTLIIPATSCAQTVTVYTPNTTVSAQAATLSCSSIPADAVSTHVVSAGQNLFRIGLSYGIHFTTLATYNGIPDATRIFVGQCIAIPPSS